MKDTVLGAKRWKDVLHVSIIMKNRYWKSWWRYCDGADIFYIKLIKGEPLSQMIYEKKFFFGFWLMFSWEDFFFKFYQPETRINRNIFNLFQISSLISIEAGECWTNEKKIEILQQSYNFVVATSRTELLVIWFFYA